MLIFEIHVFAFLINEYVDFDDAIDCHVSIVLILEDLVRVLEDIVLDIENVILEVLFIIEVPVL